MGWLLQPRHCGLEEEEEERLPPLSDGVLGLGQRAAAGGGVGVRLPRLPSPPPPIKPTAHHQEEEEEGSFLGITLVRGEDDLDEGIRLLQLLLLLRRRLLHRGMPSPMVYSKRMGVAMGWPP